MNDFDLTPPTDEQFQQLAADLDGEERKVLLEHGTEAPFCVTFLHEKREGTFTCRLCGLPLFGGGTKFESGTGWRPTSALGWWLPRPDISRPISRRPSSWSTSRRSRWSKSSNCPSRPDLSPDFRARTRSPPPPGPKMSRNEPIF